MSIPRSVDDGSPRATLARWFDAWAGGGAAAARPLAADDVVLHTTAPEELAGGHVSWDAVYPIAESRIVEMSFYEDRPA